MRAPQCSAALLLRSHLGAAAAELAAPLAPSPASPLITISRAILALRPRHCASSGGGSRAVLLAPWAGRCITSIGDSESRVVHFTSLRYAFGCTEGQLPRAERAHGAVRHRRAGCPAIARVQRRQPQQVTRNTLWLGQITGGNGGGAVRLVGSSNDCAGPSFTSSHPFGPFKLCCTH